MHLNFFYTVYGLVPALTLVIHPYLAGQVVPVGLGLLWAPPQGGLELQASLAVLVALEDP